MLAAPVNRAKHAAVDPLRAAFIVAQVGSEDMVKFQAVRHVAFCRDRTRVLKFAIGGGELGLVGNSAEGNNAAPKDAHFDGSEIHCSRLKALNIKALQSRFA